ncbi:uncharacterized protein LOC114661805 [Erpetoichthys calabaricus]|uniref:uncharacterized protein LOC114661805 n=1 Tax=Erpetoichthys calabaricus TaxID=27687 RepID=UPI0010A08682|nr:uncharacterized protein LOC114661805 [Erpetoichthys calabaricus]
MKLIVLAALFAATAAKFQFSIPQKQISTPLYTNALLPCTFSEANNKNDQKFVIITWEHKGELLVKYESGELVKQASRVKLSKGELKNGNASLALFNVTFKDEGIYECKVHEAPYSETGQVQLNVTVAPKVSVKPPFVVVNQPNVLECHAEDYYPNIISIKWRRNSTYLPGQQDVKGLANENGTFAAVNLHNYTPSEEDIGVNFSCEVKHEALDGQLVEVSQEICKPNMTFSHTTLQKGIKENVTCKVEGCHFSNVSVSWKKNETIISTKNCEAVRECVCEASLMVNSTESGEANFSCEAMQGTDFVRTRNNTFQLEDPPQGHLILLLLPILVVLVMYKAWPLPRQLENIRWMRRNTTEPSQIDGKHNFTMSDIEVPSEIRVGQEVTLSCRITVEQQEIKEVTWQTKKKGEEWQEMESAEEYVNQSGMPTMTKKGFDSTQDYVPCVLSEQMLSSVTFVPDKEEEAVSVQCQVTLALIHLSRTLFKKKSAEFSVLPK